MAKASGKQSYKYEIPSVKTLEVMRDTEAGENLTQWESISSYFACIEEKAKA